MFKVLVDRSTIGVGFVIILLITGFAGAAMIIVDPDGSIQAAINDASAGDYIVVQSGVYFEDINVNKQLSLEGVDTGKGYPIINAGDSSVSAITLSADGIVLVGFEVVDSEIGIEVNSNNSVIEANHLRENWIGIALYSSSNNIVINNEVNDNWRGINLENSDHNSLMSNAVSDNNWFGIGLTYSENNVIEKNVIHDNYYGIELKESHSNIFRDNDVFDNRFDGEPPYEIQGAYTVLELETEVSLNDPEPLVFAPNVSETEVSLNDPEPLVFAPNVSETEVSLNDPEPLVFAPNVSETEVSLNDPEPLVFAPNVSETEVSLNDPEPLVFAPNVSETEVSLNGPEPLVFASNASETEDEAIDYPPQKKSSKHAWRIYEYLKSLRGEEVEIVTSAPMEDSLLNVSKIVEEELKYVDIGAVHFYPIQNMTVGVPTIVEVNITNDFEDDLKERLESRGLSPTNTNNLNTSIKVVLNGDNFYIRSLCDEVQFVTNEKFVQWRWGVTPLKSGLEDLFLGVSVVVSVPDGCQVCRDYPQFERQTCVELSYYKIILYMVDRVSGISSSI